MRLMLVLLAGMFAYMMWRVVKIMSRTGGSREDGGVFGRSKPPDELFTNVKDADFEELKPPVGKEDPTGTKQ